MIASVRGTLESKGADRVVVQVGGIGIRVLVPATVLDEVGDPGDHVHLLTHLQVREDSLTLFGFGSPEQLRLFELLTSVNGVGPGHALGILSAGSTEAVEAAIAGENVEFLARVPRVGRKLAARIALELKGKVRAAEAVGVSGPRIADADEVVGALMALGYTAGEAQAALRAIPPDQDLPVEEKVRLALASFSRV